MQYISIDKIVPATYNPRFLPDAKKEQLKESIRQNGFCIPIIVNKSNNVIVAGHQRTKAAKELGVNEVPCFYVDGISLSDEIWFNQLHNGTDEHGQLGIYNGNVMNGFNSIEADLFKVFKWDVVMVSQICDLINRYGNVFCAVISSQEIVTGENYIKACQVLRVKVNASFIQANNSKQIHLMRDQYGEYCYKHLKKNTWVQGLAQMNRHMADAESDGSFHSVLYEKMVMPFVMQNPDVSVLDFGCGKGEYIGKLKGKMCIGIEFYNHNGKTIDVAKTRRQILRLHETASANKYFDVVVCDSVLNSVDSVEAEQSVLRCCNLFCKKGGTFFVSGLLKKNAKGWHKTASVKQRNIYFYDENGMTGTFRKGQWYYQKYQDTMQQAIDIIEQYGFKVERYFVASTAWKIQAKKINDLSTEQYAKAVDFEFNLPLPNGQSYNEQEPIKKIYGLV